MIDCITALWEARVSIQREAVQLWKVKDYRGIAGSTNLQYARRVTD